MHIHLDPVGGVAGDMFISAILHAFPAFESGMMEAIRAAGLPAELRFSVVAHRDAIITGNRFTIEEPDKLREHDHHHHHVPFRTIRTQLQGAPLASGVMRRAVAIFTLLAEAEAEVHGTAIEEVTFHELGGWDSIADIIGAAFLIENLNATWSIGALPKGSGLVHTAHGDLPVPTPATVLLLEGFELFDDGRRGERVTPTGAAIVKHLGCRQDTAAVHGKLKATGFGFGTRTFPGISNVLRVLALESQEASQWQQERVALLEFEVDDQTPEDMAIALDCIRAAPGVLDATQFAGVGKKGRVVYKIQVLAMPTHLQRAIGLCFQQTSTLGVRHCLLDRAVLERQTSQVEIDGTSVRVKSAVRAMGQMSHKVESEDLAVRASGQTERDELRTRVAQELKRK